ncbi:ATP-binding protein [Spirillospora sp. NPDC049652]
MARGLSYKDAVKILGGGSPVVEALDRLMGGVLLTATAGGSELALSLFDAKGELGRLSHELVSGLSDRMRGLSRFSRTERLEAARKVIMLAAFFDALAEADLPPRLRAFSRADQLSLVGAQPSRRLKRVVSYLTQDASAQQDALIRYDGSPHRDGLPFFEGLGIAVTELAWVEGELDLETQRVLTEVVPAAAMARYEELYLRLATDFPELAFWTDRMDHHATRAELASVRTGLEGLRAVLERLSSGSAPDDRRAALTRAHRARLDRPVTLSAESPGALRFPSLAEIYVNPRYRVAQAHPTVRLNEEATWERGGVHDDLQAFLVGYLTSFATVSEPLLLLGQPGAGKSKFTEMLAASLPPEDFMAVRVALREVPADADLQTQIEAGVRAATGEAVSWPDLARSAGDALPVVLLDGFDELLQATGVSQSDYLEQVVRFQEREAAQGRPVAVLVTSRTSVADRMRIPNSGIVAVRLEPFSEEQTARWLDVWNNANAAALAARGLSPLPVKTALRHSELASQPLLLLMLALYDSDDNALQKDDHALDSADLYERLLTRFAEREVRKLHPELDGAAFADAVEDELQRLSITAFAMFNRGRQWVTEDELSGDLAALLPDPGGARQASLRATLTPGQTVVGRFFFVHRAQAVQGGEVRGTYEFLHATFGEYLVARLIVRELSDLVTFTQATRNRHQRLDDAFLHALLSFAPLTERNAVVSFVRFLIARSPVRAAMGDLLYALFHEAFTVRTGRTLTEYEPLRSTVPARVAVHSANLLVLLVVAKDRLTGSEVFPDSSDPVEEWQRCTGLWRSQLTAEGWLGLASAMSLTRIWTDDRPDILLLNAPMTFKPSKKADWFLHSSAHARILRSGSARLVGTAHFACQPESDVLIHALESPLWDVSSMEPLVTSFADSSQGIVSGAHAYLRLCWAALNPDIEQNELVQRYEDCLAFLRGAAATDWSVLLLRQLIVDAERLPPGWRRSMYERLSEHCLPGSPTGALFDRALATEQSLAPSRRISWNAKG